jgi:murein L,D-transpeptidase YafK
MLDPDRTTAVNKPQPPSNVPKALEPAPEPPAPPVTATRPLRVSEAVHLPSESGDRVARARERAEPALRELFTAAEVPYPADGLYLRAFKREGELELWAAAKRQGWTLITTYQVAGASGGPGPKRKEGDGQVPEGFYVIDRFNSKSSYHLSLGINYPNAADRILGDPQKPGYDIFIHGRAASIGCLAMGDDRMEEIYLAALDTRTRPIPVHIFPARMDAPDWNDWRDELTREDSSLGDLWAQLHAGWNIFEEHREVPQVIIEKDGRYTCRRP